LTIAAAGVYKGEMTSLLYTLGAFAIILLLARFKVPLAAAIIAGAVAAGVMFGMGPRELAAAVPSAAIQPKAVGLVVITLIQLVLSAAMEVAGQMERIVTLAKAFFRRPAVTMAALPAMIGLLPMPGGALFSAPMVESAAAGQDIKGDKLSAINYWFRHIWEHWWPLYPGVLLAMALTASDFGTFAAFQIPLGIFMVTSGLLIFRRTHPDLHAAGPPPPAGIRRKLLWATSSIWIIILVWIPCAFGVKLLPLSALPQTTADSIVRFGPIAGGLAAGLIWTVFLNRMGGRAFARIGLRKSIYAMIALVISVMIFQHVLEKVEAAPKIAAELAAFNVPPLLAVIILPAIAGMVTGLAFGFVGTSFPIVLGVVAAMPGVSIRPYVALAYACGHLGMMLSPIHLCYVVSNRYFKTSFGPVYKYILLPAAMQALLAGIYFVVLNAVMNR